MSLLRQIPNVISVFRILLVIPIIVLMLREEYAQALILFAVAGVSDGLDGFLAKRFQWQTWIGGVLDPLADKVLLVSTFLALGWLGRLPWWLVGLVFLRDLVIVAGALIYHYRIGKVNAEPTIISKVNTFMQILLVLVAMLAQIFALPAPLVTILIYLVAVTTVISGLDYVIKWGRRASVVHK
ncbi:MAG: CDP-alcohol phosphatidyltransferase family protein [Gammaproteobacteria bacterium]